jgi:Flp pilus assembly CpaF family ATPase
MKCVAKANAPDVPNFTTSSVAVSYGCAPGCARIETMAMMSSVHLPDKAIRAQIASAVSMIVQIARTSDGSRCVTHVTELTGSFSDVISIARYLSV